MPFFGEKKGFLKPNGGQWHLIDVFYGVGGFHD
jgi:hypothetical protein